MKQFRWIGVFFGTVLAVLLIVFLFNYGFNPYRADLKGVKKYHLNIDQNLERALKLGLYQAGKDRFDTIIFGSSRSGFVDPGDISSSTFNFSFSAGRIWEMTHIVKTYLALDRVKQIYFFVDEFMFYPLNTKTGPFYFESPDMFSKLTVFLSLDVTWDIVKTIFDTPNYAYEFNGKKRRLYRKRISDASIATYLSSRSELIENGDYVFSPDRAKAFNAFLQVCEANGIELTLIINPITAVLRKYYLAENPGYGPFLDFIGQGDFSQPIFDFNYDNDVTEDYEQFYDDLHHYKPEVGRYMVDYILREERFGDFGRRHF